MIKRIRLDRTCNSDLAWTLLEREGIEILFGETEGDIEELVVKSDLNSDKFLQKFPFITSCHSEVLPEMDWEKEWEKHALHFSDGKVQLDLNPYGGNSTLILMPGAGFGELSHPTTRLVLELMKGRVSGKTVIDIGSGSGILALAAKALGASEVIGIDIDRQANLHAAKNAALNQLDVRFFHPDEMDQQFKDEPVVILMNMITSEQQVAWKSFNQNLSGIALTSGMLQEQEKAYRKLVKSWGWTINKVISEEGWLGIEATIKGENGSV